MKELINKYVWIVDTLNRYDRLTRKELNDLWRRSAYGDGNDMPERTFYNYRRGIEENFHIDILCDKTGHYYIDPGQREQNKSCLLYTSPSPRDPKTSRMPSSA